MKCYTITYRIQGQAGTMVGSGYGNTPEEAAEDFDTWHDGEAIEEIVDIKFYK